MSLRERCRKEMRDQMRVRMIGKYSFCPGSLLRSWENTIIEVGAQAVWDLLYDIGMVQFYETTDDLPAHDLFGDCFDEHHASTIPGGLRELRAQEKRAIQRLDDCGQWIVFTQVRLDVDEDTGAGWEDVDSLGGFVGDDFFTSGYMPGCQMEAFDRVAKHCNVPSWRECCDDIRQRPLVFATTLAMAGIPLPNDWQQTVRWDYESKRTA